MIDLERAKSAIRDNVEELRKHRELEMQITNEARDSATTFALAVAKFRHALHGPDDLSYDGLVKMADEFTRLSDEFVVDAERWEIILGNQPDHVVDFLFVHHLLEEQVDYLDKHALTNRSVRVEVWKKTGGKCSYCHKPLAHPYEEAKEGQESMHVDHVVPKSAGGPDHMLNYAPSCGPCNISKNGRDVVVYISSLQKVLK